MTIRLKSPHKDWKIDLLGVPDAKAFGVDELLTKLWLRIEYENRPTVTRTASYTKVVELAAELQDPHNSAFIGFEPGSGIAESWLRADLLRVFKSAKLKEEFSVARPLHLLATRLRNARKADDSGASAIVYHWLSSHAPELLHELREWLDIAADDRETQSLDLASYALVRLAENREPDVPKPSAPSQHLETCEGQGRAYCEDLRALLAYRGLLPRTVLIAHVGRLTALHVGLALLRLYQVVVDVEQTGSRRCASCTRRVAPEEGSTCPYALELVADCAEDRRSATTSLAEESWLEQEELLARYVRSHLTLRKLQEAADDVGRRGGLPKTTLEEIAAVEGAAVKAKFDVLFVARLQSLIESADAEDRETLQALRAQYETLDLSPFRVYMAILHYLSETRWYNYHRFVLDSCFLKNAGDGAMRQPLGGRRRRRIALSAPMVETLTLVALIDQKDLHTRPLRVDELIDKLASRYGLLIARPPSRLGDDADATKAMIDNHHEFRRLLRETGLFVDLSDAFLAQAIRPRVEVR